MTDEEIKRIYAASVLCNAVSDEFKQLMIEPGLSETLFLAACDLLCLVCGHRTEPELERLSQELGIQQIGDFWESRRPDIDRYFRKDGGTPLTWSTEDNRKLLTEFLDWLLELEGDYSLDDRLAGTGGNALIDRFLSEREPKCIASGKRAMLKQDHLPQVVPALNPHL